MTDYGPLKRKEYRPRLVDVLMRKKLEQFGAIEVCGTRWCGKSWTAEAFARSFTHVDDNPEIYMEEPDLALHGDAPHAIDEWQDVPRIWNRVRHAVDDSSNKPGQFILTGSSSPLDQETRHSGAGRIGRIRMHTMTLAELGVSSGTVSLAKLFEGEFDAQPSRLSLEELARIVCQGGWPALIDQPLDRAQATVDEYLSVLFDISMRGLGKDPQLSRRIALALARNVGTSSTLDTLAKDAAEDSDSLPAAETVSSYLTGFALNYFIDELPGWDAPVRSRSRVRTKPKRYLDDPSMAASLLAVSPERLLQDGQLFGSLFESLCVHDIGVYASLLPGAQPQPIRYYADADGLEVDIVIELRDGRWAGLEVKLGEAKADQGAANLLRLRDKVRANPAARNPDPAFLAVVVGKGAFARQRKQDGVYILPIDTLTA